MKHKLSHVVGASSVIQIILIVLKCIEVIDWSWWSVLIPTWIDIGLFVITVIIGVITAYISFDDDNYPW